MGFPSLISSNSPYGLCGRKAILNLKADYLNAGYLNAVVSEIRNCVKVEVAVLGSTSLIRW